MRNTGLLIRTAIILVITLVALYLVFGPRNSFTAQDFSWAGIKKNLAENINLGLDLEGGSHLVMHVKTDEYLKELTKNNKEAALLAAKEAQLPVGEASYVTEKNNYQVALQVADASKRQEIIDAVKQKVDFANWTQNETDNSITWSLPVQVQNLLSQQAVDQALKIIEGRINTFGVKEPTLQRVGSNESSQILLQMPGVADPERVKNLIGSQSRLEMVNVISPPSPSAMQTFPSREAAL